MKTTAQQITSVCEFLRKHDYDDMELACRILTAGGMITEKPWEVLEYRGYLIEQEGGWIGFRYEHEDYDGADDSIDNRCGSHRNLDVVLDEIDELEADRND